MSKELNRCMANIEGFRKYSVFPDGRVYSLWKNGFIKPSHQSNGYLSVTLYSEYANPPKQFLVHRLVLTAFGGKCPAEMEADHVNGDRHDNKIQNLRWVYPHQNTANRMRLGNIICGSAVEGSKLTEKDVEEIRSIADWWSRPILAEYYGVRVNSIQNIISGRTWKYV